MSVSPLVIRKTWALGKHRRPGHPEMAKRTGWSPAEGRGGGGTGLHVHAGKSQEPSYQAIFYGEVELLSGQVFQSLQEFQVLGITRLFIRDDLGSLRRGSVERGAGS